MDGFDERIMYFSTLSELFRMDGHGVYVWSAYAIVALVMAGLLRAAMLKPRRVLENVRRRLASRASGR